MKKEKILWLAAVLVCLAIAASGTMAYVTGVDKVDNVITTGKVSIDIDEKMELPSGELVEFPEEGVHGVQPGTSVSKIVSVGNTGSGDAWVRIRVEMRIWDKNDAELPLEIEVDGETVPVMSFEVDESRWIYSDGYYYYADAVEPGEYTDIFFEEVYFHDKAHNEYQDCTANVIIYAEAVQTANNPIPDGGDVTGVKGWPENN